MNRNWMVIGIVAALILAASIIGIPSIVTTLLLQFIFDLEPLATFLVLLCIVPLMATLMLIGIIWLVISLARLLGFAVAQTWPRNITLSAISLLSAFLSGLTLAKIGSVVIVHYALNPIIGSAIYLIAVILYMIAAGLAIGQVMETKNKKWTYSIIVIVFACLVIVGTVNIYRNDNYDPKTGKSIVYITPSTGKLWRNKPVGFNFDPANGEKLVLVTPEMLAKANQQIPKSGFDVIPGTGYYVYEVAKNEETNWKVVPKHLYWSLSAKQNGDWDLIPFTGKVVTYQKDQDQLVDLTGLDNTFKIKNKGDDMVFDLIVKPRT